MFLKKCLKYSHLTNVHRKTEHLDLRSVLARLLSSSSSTNVTEPAQHGVVPSLFTEALGQPTAASHPHVLNKGELVPGIGVEEFQDRRVRLMTAIQRFSRDSLKHICKNNKNVVIVPSATKKYMSDKIPYVFRQQSDFFYLSGCLEPDTVLMMYINEHDHVKSILFMRPKDKHAELWDGARTGVDHAIDMFGVDEAHPRHKFLEELKGFVERENPLVWYDTANSGQEKVTENVKFVLGNSQLMKSPTNFVQNLRLFKSASEQALMRRTCKIASEAINDVMEETRPGQSEHHIYAMVDYKCRMNNASYLAYPPVVASGINTTTIHYINNSQLTKSGDLVLLDAGCEYGGYTSDITRTWPINGVFSEAQKVLYDVVYLLQKELIGTLMQEGGDTLDNLFDTMCTRLGKYLQEAGLVPKHIVDDNSYAKAGFDFCPHHVSHYLGMDVHDTPLMPRTLRLLPGMVFTVEPGVYVNLERKDVPKEFRGMGIRIEDDVLISSDGHVEILTASCIKNRSQLENLFKEKR